VASVYKNFTKLERFSFLVSLLICCCCCCCVCVFCILLDFIYVACGLFLVLLGVFCWNGAPSWWCPVCSSSYCNPVSGCGEFGL